MNRKTAIVTGASSGVGRATAVELSRRGWHVILAARSLEKTEPILQGITAFGGSAEICQVDLGDLDSVRDAANSIIAKHTHIDLLINNAGIAGYHGRTVDGFEIHFGVNHLGHFLLTRLLLPLLVSSGMSRIVNVSSGSHYEADCLDLSNVCRPTQYLSGLPEYERSKLCNVLFTLELRRRLAQTDVTCVSLHPGQVRSGIWNVIPQPIRWIMTRNFLSDEEGAARVLHCALAPDVSVSPALYYDEMDPAEPSAIAQNVRAAQFLWTKSSRWVGLEV